MKNITIKQSVLCFAAATFMYSCTKPEVTSEKVVLRPNLLSEVKMATSTNKLQRPITTSISGNLEDYTANYLYNFYYPDEPGNKKTTVLQYQVGSAKCPLILSSAHGVDSDFLSNSPIPFWASWSDKTQGTLLSDNKTTDFTLEIAKEFENLTGGSRPHVIINQIHRRKMDPNQVPGRQDPTALKAYNAFHKCLDIATDKVDAVFKQTGGILIDVHGHAHQDANKKPIEIADVGYNLSAEDYSISNGDSFLNDNYMKSSIANMKSFSGSVSFGQRVRGQNSLGDLLQINGIKSTPSPVKPIPTSPYFQGGDIIRIHGSKDFQRKTSAIQIEFAHSYKRTDEIRSRNAKNVAKALILYLKAQYNITFSQFNY